MGEIFSEDTLIATQGGAKEATLSDTGDLRSRAYREREDRGAEYDSNVAEMVEAGEVDPSHTSLAIGRTRYIAGDDKGAAEALKEAAVPQEVPTEDSEYTEVPSEGPATVRVKPIEREPVPEYVEPTPPPTQTNAEIIQELEKAKPAPFAAQVVGEVDPSIQGEKVEGWVDQQWRNLKARGEQAGVEYDEESIKAQLRGEAQSYLGIEEEPSPLPVEDEKKPFISVEAAEAQAGIKEPVQVPPLAKGAGEGSKQKQALIKLSPVALGKPGVYGEVSRSAAFMTLTDDEQKQVRERAIEGAVQSLKKKYPNLDEADTRAQLSEDFIEGPSLGDDVLQVGSDLVKGFKELFGSDETKMEEQERKEKARAKTISFYKTPAGQAVLTMQLVQGRVPEGATSIETTSMRQAEAERKFIKEGLPEVQARKKARQEVPDVPISDLALGTWKKTAKSFYRVARLYYDIQYTNALERDPASINTEEVKKLQEEREYYLAKEEELEKDVPAAFKAAEKAGTVYTKEDGSLGVHLNPAHFLGTGGENLLTSMAIAGVTALSATAFGKMARAAAMTLGVSAQTTAFLETLAVIAGSTVAQLATVPGQEAAGVGDELRVALKERGFSEEEINTAVARQVGRAQRVNQVVTAVLSIPEGLSLIELRGNRPLLKRLLRASWLEGMGEVPEEALQNLTSSMATRLEGGEFDSIQALNDGLAAYGSVGGTVLTKAAVVKVLDLMKEPGVKTEEPSPPSEPDPETGILPDKPPVQGLSPEQLEEMVYGTDPETEAFLKEVGEESPGAQVISEEPPTSPLETEALPSPTAPSPEAITTVQEVVKAEHGLIADIDLDNIPQAYYDAAKTLVEAADYPIPEGLSSEEATEDIAQAAAQRDKREAVTPTPAAEISGVVEEEGVIKEIPLAEAPVEPPLDTLAAMVKEVKEEEAAAAAVGKELPPLEERVDEILQRKAEELVQEEVKVREEVEEEDGRGLVQEEPTQEQGRIPEKDLQVPEKPSPILPIKEEPTKDVKPTEEVKTEPTQARIEATPVPVGEVEVPVTPEEVIKPPTEVEAEAEITPTPEAEKKVEVKPEVPTPPPGEKRTLDTMVRELVDIPEGEATPEGALKAWEKLYRPEKKKIRKRIPRLEEEGLSAPEAFEQAILEALPEGERKQQIQTFLAPKEVEAELGKPLPTAQVGVGIGKIPGKGEDVGEGVQISEKIARSPEIDITPRFSEETKIPSKTPTPPADPKVWVGDSYAQETGGRGGKKGKPYTVHYMQAEGETRFDPLRAAAASPFEVVDMGFSFPSEEAAAEFLRTADVSTISQGQNLIPSHIRVMNPKILEAREVRKWWKGENSEEGFSEGESGKTADGMLIDANESMLKRGFAPRVWILSGPAQIAPAISAPTEEAKAIPVKEEQGIELSLEEEVEKGEGEAEPQAVGQAEPPPVSAPDGAVLPEVPDASLSLPVPPEEIEEGKALYLYPGEFSRGETLAVELIREGKENNLPIEWALDALDRLIDRGINPEHIAGEDVRWASFEPTAETVTEISGGDALPIARLGDDLLIVQGGLSKLSRLRSRLQKGKAEVIREEFEEKRAKVEAEETITPLKEKVKEATAISAKAEEKIGKSVEGAPLSNLEAVRERLGLAKDVEEGATGREQKILDRAKAQDEAEEKEAVEATERKTEIGKAPEGIEEAMQRFKAEGKEITKLPDEEVGYKPVIGMRATTNIDEDAYQIALAPTPQEELKENLHNTSITKEEIQELFERAEILLGDAGMIKFVSSLYTPTGQRAYGEMTGAENLIILATNSPDLTSTLNHEGLHWAQRNLFTEEENQSLLDIYTEGGKEWVRVADSLVEEMGEEHRTFIESRLSPDEAIARDFEAYAKKASPDIEAVSLFEKFLEFLKGIKTLFASAGYKTSQDIFKALHKGEIGKRAKKRSALNEILAPIEDKYQEEIKLPEPLPPGPARHKATFKSMIENSVKRGLSIAPEKIDSEHLEEKGVKQVIQEIADSLTEDVKSGRKVPIAETHARALAQYTDTSEDTLIAMARKLGGNRGASTTLAAMELLLGKVGLDWATKLEKILEKAKTGEVRTIDTIAMNTAHGRLEEVVRAYADIKSDVARALRFQQENAQAYKKFAKDLEAVIAAKGGSNDWNKVARYYEKFAEAPTLPDALHLTKRQGFWETVAGFRIMGMISGFSTTMLNVYVNSAFLAESPIRSLVETYYTLGGKPGETVYLTEAPAKILGAIFGIIPGIVAAGRLLATEENTFIRETDRYDTKREILGRQLSAQTVTLLAKTLGGTGRGPISMGIRKVTDPLAAVAGRMYRGVSVTTIGSVDELFSAMMEWQKLAALGVRAYHDQTRSPGGPLLDGSTGDRIGMAKFVLDYMKNPPEEAAAEAIQEAAALTMRADLEGFNKDFHQFLQDAPAAKTFIPFFKVLVNEATQLIQRTPRIILKGSRAGKQLLEGGVPEAEVRAKRTLGTLAILGGAVLAMNGIFTPGAGDDWRTRKLKRSALGIIPYAFRGEDGLQRSTERAGGLFRLLGVGADTWQLYQRLTDDIDRPNEEDLEGHILFQTLRIGWEGYLESTYAGSIQDFTEAFSSQSKAVSYASSLASSFSPNFIKQWFKWDDPVGRDAYAEGLVEKVKNKFKVGGAERKTLAPIVNVLGMPVILEGSLVWRVVGPGEIRRENEDEVAQAFLKVNYIPQDPNRNVKVFNEKLPRHLSGRDYALYSYYSGLEIYGPKTRHPSSHIPRYLESPEWENPPGAKTEREANEIRREGLRKRVSLARERARQRFEDALRRPELYEEDYQNLLTRVKEAVEDAAQR